MSDGRSRVSAPPIHISPIHASSSAAPMSDAPAYRTSAAAAPSKPSAAVRPGAPRGRASCHTKQVKSARKSGSLNTEPCTITIAGDTARKSTPSNPPRRLPPSAAARRSAMVVMAAPMASTRRAEFCGVSPAATPSEMVAGKPGGKCASAAVVSGLSHGASGTRSSPVCASDAPALRYCMASGSSPGPGGSVSSSTAHPAARPRQAAMVMVMSRNRRKMGAII